MLSVQEFAKFLPTLKNLQSGRDSIHAVRMNMHCEIKNFNELNCVYNSCGGYDYD